MKAIIQTKYGAPEVLRVADIAKPTPKNTEILIKIHAASVTTADSMMRTGFPLVGRLVLGLFKPKNPILGTGLAGTVEAIGKDVTKFKTGDKVFGESLFGTGTNAEYVCVDQNGILAILPKNISFAEAAPVGDGAITSLNFLRDVAKIKPGQRVLINGASGSLGTAAVQLAKYFGAHVTGVCSTSNLEMVKNLRADAVIDYTVQDFTNSSNTYDIIYDTVGKSSFSKTKHMLTKNGTFVTPVLGMGGLMDMLWTSFVGTKKAKFAATGMRSESDLRAMFADVKTLFENDNLVTVMDQNFQMDQIVEAHRYIDKGHKKGNVVLAVA